MTFKVKDRGEFGLFVGGVDMRIGADLLQRCTIIENAQMNVPSVALTFVDDKKRSMSFGAFADSAPLEVIIGDGIREPRRYKFRTFSMEKGTINTAGSVISINGVADIVPWFRKTVDRNFRMPASQVVQQLASQAGMLTDVDGTSDEMNWLPDNRAIGQFARKVIDHSWMGGGSSPFLAVTSQGGQWMARVKNILSLAGSDARRLVSMGLNRAGDHMIVDYKITSKSGAMNGWVNYGHNVIQENESGIVDIFKNMSFAKGVSALGINGQMAEQIGSALNTYLPQAIGNCQTGDTLIPTERGILRMDELVKLQDSGKEEYSLPLKLRVGGRYKPEKTSLWYYSGKKPTMNIKTRLGNELNCTYEHPNLVFDPSTGEVNWKKAIDCNIGDLLCINPRQIVRKSKLHLKINTSFYESARLSDVGYNTTVPKFMTPELASIIGYLVSEGTVNAYCASFTNTDKRLVKHYVSCIKKVFNIKSMLMYGKGRRPGLHIKGVKVKSIKPGYTVRTYSRPFGSTLVQLGLGPETSKDKTVPWSILQADGESQLAFLAAYLEGDGTIDNTKGRLTWYTSSEKLSHQLLVLLNSHGVMPSRYLDNKGMWRVVLGGHMSNKLWEKLKPYMRAKHRHVKEKFWAKGYGVPLAYWQNLVASRKLGPTTYVDDSGRAFEFSRAASGEAAKFQNLLTLSEIVRYEQYDNGELDIFLSFLKRVSVSGYKKLKYLLKLRYYFNSITSLSKTGKKHVYDISMRSGVAPAFIANGMVVHNTHRYYAQAMHHNRKARAAFSTLVYVTTTDLTEYKLLDDANVTLALSDGSVDTAYSGNYKVTAISRHISKGAFVEKLELSSQGTNADVFGGGL